MKRLLILTPRFPYPPIGGDRLRIFQICKNLSRDLELSLLSMCESEEEMDYCVPADGVFSHVERVYHSRLQRLKGCASVLASKTPLQIGYYRNPQFARQLKSMLPHCDGVFAHLIRTGSYLNYCEKPKFLEMTDAISLTYNRARGAASDNVARRLLYRTESARLLQYETDIMTRFDLSILVSAVDRDALLQGKQNSRVIICPNGVDTDALRFNYTPDGRTILFIGNNKARHNADAILYFAEKVLPSIRARIEDAELRIIGPTPRTLRDRLRKISGIVVVGTVDSIADAASGASIGVCPTRFGAGIQNKLLEYMSMGLPTVTSSIGAEGLAAVPGAHLFVAEGVEEWTDRICDLLRNPSLGAGLARAARKLVEEEYSWSSMLDPLRRSVCEVLESAAEAKKK